MTETVKKTAAKKQHTVPKGIRQLNDCDRPFTKVNYIMMAVCVALIVIGFMLMSGGGDSNATTFDPEIFSTRRIVVGPTITFLGFLCMAFAIIWTPKKKSDKAKKDNTENQLKNGVA